jgi:ribosomal protein L7/L12
VEDNDPSRLPEEQIEAIRDSLSRGNKIEAIKHYREATGLGLAESKALIDALELRLRQQEPDQFAAPAKKAGCVGAVAIAALLTTALRCWL